MHSSVTQMLKRYKCVSVDDYENALKEIIQEIALLGLWRSKFFEIGAFYGGTALRILHGLERFSEDMDFSLLKPNPNFDISIYESSLKRELLSFGFDVEVEKKSKKSKTSIESAFIKGNTLVHLMKISVNLKTHKERLLKIKVEVDINPPKDFNTQVVTHFRPIPFSVKAFDLPSLFAGKIAAALYRPYKLNTKGRDWFDFFWYISNDVPLNIKHLKARMVQIEKWPKNQKLSIEDVRHLLIQRIDEIDLARAKSDVMPFVKDQQFVKSWSKPLLKAAVERLRAPPELSR